MNEPDFCSLLDCTIPYNLPVWKKVIWLRSYQYRTPLLLGLKNKSNIYISWIEVVIIIFNAKILNKESFSEIGNTANSDLGGQQDRGSLIGRGGGTGIYAIKRKWWFSRYVIYLLILRGGDSQISVELRSSVHQVPINCKKKKTLKWHLSCIAPSISKSLMIRSLFH